MRPGGHQHPANQRRHDQRTRSELLADRVTAAFGSWTFIIAQTMIVVLWIGLNLLALRDGDRTAAAAVSGAADAA